MKKTTTFILLSFLTVLLLTSSLHPVNEVKEGTITNLYDAFSKNNSLTKDFGFSCITKYKGKTILFDAGSNANIFKSNTTKLGVDLSKVDIVVISHGHFDHLNGLDYLLTVNPKVKIYFPDDFYWGAPVHFDATGQDQSVKDSLPQHMQYFSGASTKFTIVQSGRFWNANIEFINASKEILPGLSLIATSSPFTGYFSCYPGKHFVEGQFEKPGDNCKQAGLPELSLSMKTKKGEVLIAGCSHSGIENIIAECIRVTGNNIELAYGGFHLLPFNREQTRVIINKLKNELKVNRVAPAHCTGHLAFKMLQDNFGHNYVYGGLGETISY